MRAVIAWIEGLTNVETWPNTFTLDLLTHKGVCRGALVWNPVHGKTLVWAKQTILCTGGVGQIYRETTNPEVATGDGLAVAYRAGAELRDMEFTQFHPTVLYIAGSSRNLITEAIRGAGAYLVDRNGYRFMPDYDPRLELAPRDVVSRAIVAQMRRRGIRMCISTCGIWIATKSPGPFSRNRRAVRRVRDWIWRRSDSGPARGPLHDRRSDGRPRRPDDARRACGPPAKSPPAACTGRIGWPRTACSKAWFTAPTQAGEHRWRPQRSSDDFHALPLENHGARSGRAAESGRHPQFAQKPDVAGRRRLSRRAATGRGGPRPRPLVPLRAGAAIQRAGGLGAAEHAARGPADDRRGAPREETRGVHVRTDFPATDDEHWQRHISFCRP